jgi:16S rRNA (adenine1518-N6/adenine1519-N6)-dimethyltransferase
VSREVFVPKPDVNSSVLAFLPKRRTLPEGFDEKLFFSLVRSGFNQRRKTLRNSLSALGFGNEVLLSAFETVGLDPGLRAEALGVEDFIALATAFAKAE